MSQGKPRVGCVSRYVFVAICIGHKHSSANTAQMLPRDFSSLAAQMRSLSRVKSILECAPVQNLVGW